MNRIIPGIVGLAAVASVAVVGGQQAKPDDASLIKSAMSAAPAAVAKDAAIVDMMADGKMRTVRKGSNNYTCMANNPETPGPDPMCGDANAMEWVHAWLTKAPPPTNKVGFMYMLAGGTDASNTYLYVKKPTASNNWISTGPHVMVVGAKGMMDGYPRDAKPDTSRPYVMWPELLYEHLMMPIR